LKNKKEYIKRMR